jgi:hypothetical protein
MRLILALILALLLGLLATVADCTPSSTPLPQTGAPGAPGPSAVGPVPSERPFPTPTIEVPPPIY